MCIRDSASYWSKAMNCCRRILFVTTRNSHGLKPIVILLTGQSDSCTDSVGTVTTGYDSKEASDYHPFGQRKYYATLTRLKPIADYD